MTREEKSAMYQQYRQEQEEKKRNSFLEMANAQIKVYESLKNGIERSIPVFDNWAGKVCNQRLVTDLRKNSNEQNLRYEFTQIDDNRFRLRIEERRTSNYHSEMYNKDLSLPVHSASFYIITGREGRVNGPQTMICLYDGRDRIAKSISEYQEAFLLYDKAVYQWNNLVSLAEEYKKTAPQCLQGKIDLKEKIW